MVFYFLEKNNKLSANLYKSKQIKNYNTSFFKSKYGNFVVKLLPNKKIIFKKAYLNSLKYYTLSITHFFLYKVVVQVLINFLVWVNKIPYIKIHIKKKKDSTETNGCTKLSPKFLSNYFIWDKTFIPQSPSNSKVVENTSKIGLTKIIYPTLVYINFLLNN
jgi:hypothetical protein